MYEAGAKAVGDKLRGTGKGYVHKNVNGRQKLLHRLIYEEYVGRELLPYPEEIVHHKDRDKKHNCVPGKILCGRLFCEGNLELLSGEAAKEHIRIHYAELYEAKHGKPYDPDRPWTADEIKEQERLETYYADGGF